MCKGGKRNSFLVGIGNGAWRLWNSDATGSHNYLSIPSAKQCYCCNNIFCSNISVKLLLVYSGICCIRMQHVLLIAKKCGEVEAAAMLTKGQPAEILWIKQVTCRRFAKTGPGPAVHLMHLTLILSAVPILFCLTLNSATLSFTPPVLLQLTTNIQLSARC